jgi:RNA polymerase sigma-70 factor (ECF subfamily)
MRPVSTAGPRHPHGGQLSWFEELFVSNYEDLLRFAVRRVGANDAQDVVSEVFAVRWRRRDEMPKDAARLWLFGVANGVISNSDRSARRETRLRERAQGDPSSSYAEHSSDHADSAATRTAVLAALATLSHQDQEALRLTEWEGLRPFEAACVLGLSQSLFRVRLHRARRRLATALSDLRPDPSPDIDSDGRSTT